MHQWAENPRTIGALAGTQLAIRAAVSKEGANENMSFDPEMKNKIRQAGAIPKFVAFLSSGEVDRVHTAVVALSFLCMDNPQNSMETYDSSSFADCASPLHIHLSTQRESCDVILVNWEKRDTHGDEEGCGSELAHKFFRSAFR